jgi:hypothetical protein
MKQARRRTSRSVIALLFLGGSTACAGSNPVSREGGAPMDGVSDGGTSEAPDAAGATGEPCSSDSECSGGICIPVGNAAGCTFESMCYGSCCLNVNVGGSVAGACNPGPCALQLCTTTSVIACPSPDTCVPFLNRTGVCAPGPLGGEPGDGGGPLVAPTFPSHVCSTACKSTADCIAGWACGALAGQPPSTACLCSASFEVCDGRDNDCNGIVDDEPGADRWCWLVDGPGHLCRGGQCVCPGTCGGMTGSDAGSGDDASVGDGSSASEPSDAATSYDPSVYQHHKNGTRDGLYVDPTLTTSAAATMHSLGFMGTVSASVYAQPLYVEQGPGGQETILVATEENHLTAFNAATGAVIWDQGPTAYGQPVTGGLPCERINPLGITGTPFIDPASPINSGEGVVYFDAMTTPDNNATAKHMVYAVSLADGTVLPDWPVDVGARVDGFTPGWQKQRGALQLVNGVLYVPYGGLTGDCPKGAPTYYGWVVGVPVANPQNPSAWQTGAYKGGIWGPGALPTDGRSIFPVTGNTVGASSWSGGEAVIRLAATPSGPTFSGNTADYYAPSNWHSLDTTDLDLGGASDVLFDMPGAFRPHLVAAGGKDSNFYLLDRDNLGGIGGQLLRQSVGSCQLLGAPAAYTTSRGSYVAFHLEQAGDGGTACCPGSPATIGSLVAVEVVPSASGFSARIAWCAPDSGLGSPMVTTTDGTSNAIVWAADNRLWGYDGDTGQKLFTGNSTAMSTSVQGWNTPIGIGGGRIAVGVNGLLYVFGAP